MRLTIWIRSAFTAKDIEEKDPYIIIPSSETDSTERIVVVDKDTGVEQHQMQWSHGLHQFLQLKHTQKLAVESLKAVFISNFNYFKGKDRIYGLTGTLGSTLDQELLQKTYQVDFFRMPRYRRSRFFEESGVICPSTLSWHEAIKEDVRKKLLSGKKRAVLIICENVATVELLEQLLKDLPPVTGHIHKYVSAFKEFKVGYDEAHPLKPGDVIIATNLAGRGTDLFINDELNKNGGLHVILTYLPSNIRIEEQAFGRAARKGQNGSGVFVLFYPQCSVTLDQLRRVRDLREQEHIENIRKNNLRAIIMEEKLFCRFTELYKNIKKDFLNENKILYGKGYIELQLKSLNDYWAFWLDSIAEKMQIVSMFYEDLFFQEYEQFHKEILCLSQEKNLFKFIHSPHELTALGKYFLGAGKNQLALDCFNEVIEFDERNSEIAHYYKALCLSKIKPLDIFIIDD